MSDKKHIDRLFQEKFKDFEVAPNDALWSDIETKLNKNKKRRVIPIWWRYAGAAAILLFLLTIGNSFLNTSKSNDTKPTNNVVNIESEKKKPILNIENTNVDKSIIKSGNNLVKIDSNKNYLEKDSFKDKLNTGSAKISNKQSVIANNSLDKNNSNPLQNNTLITNKNEISERKDASSKEKVIANSNISKDVINNSQSSKDISIEKINKKYNGAIADTFEKKENNIDNVDIGGSQPTTINSANEINKIPNNIVVNKNIVKTKEKEESKNENLIKNELETETIEEAIANNLDNNEEDKNVNRWSVTPNAAPVYFNTLGKGSSISNQFIDNSKTGEVNMSYGINGSYAVTKKLILRSGISKLNLAYKTSNVLVYDYSDDTISLGTAPIAINTNNNIITSNVALIDKNSLEGDNVSAEYSDVLTSSDINQSLSYIEIPLEFQYMVLDKKLGINVIGGFSSFFLDSNQLFSETNNSKTLIGKAVNLNKVSYSANFGIGLNYKASDKINFNLEPMFKRQIKTFKSNSGNFKPYFIGIYTGVGFKF